MMSSLWSVRLLTLVAVALLDCIPVVHGRGTPWLDDGMLASSMRTIQQWSDPESTASNETTIVPNQYIVRFGEQLSNEELERKAALVAKVTGGTILWIYRRAFQGVAIAVNTSQSISMVTPTMLRAQRLGSFQENRRFSLDVVTDKDDTDRRQRRQRHRDLAFEFMTPNNTVIPVGIDRIDQEEATPLDGQYRHDNNGTGVTVYVLDSGIRTSHVEFEGRATCGFDFYDVTRSCTDDFNHGTHVAGTIGGRRSGVAKNVALVGVKVLDQDGSGTDAAVLAGIDYVLDQKQSDPSRRIVVNMSFGRVYSVRYNWAVRRLVRAGIVVVVAAGNMARNACWGSPASAAHAITVGSFDYSYFYKMEQPSSFTNHGKCVDLFAPGHGITSASGEDDINFATFSGTSMSTPHVAGAAALYLEQNPSWSPDQVKKALLNDALTGKLLPSSMKRSPNRILYTGKL